MPTGPVLLDGDSLDSHYFLRVDVLGLEDGAECAIGDLLGDLVASAGKCV